MLELGSDVDLEPTAKSFSSFMIRLSFPYYLGNIAGAFIPSLEQHPCCHLPSFYSPSVLDVRYLDKLAASHRRRSGRVDAGMHASLVRADFC